MSVLLAAAGLAQSGESTGRPRAIVGAIRWDAWTGGPVTREVEQTLGPKRYHPRLPWFAEVIGDGEVRIDGNRQEVMDREIGWAAGAGLDYWAFLLYPESSPMSAALKQYLASPERGKIKFCLILHNSLGVNSEQWPRERDRALQLLKEPGYQTVLKDRPLIFAFIGKDFPFARFSELLAGAKENGLSPYCVFMGWNPVADYKRVSTRGFDAVSAYAKAGSQPRFEDLALAAEKDWQTAADGSVPYVPLVTTGWDKRPRKDHPVSWEKDHNYHQQEVFPSAPRPAEIASHLARAIAFVRAKPSVCPAQAVIIYAWNEFDEGGWLCPTLSEETARLDAIRKVLEER